MPEEDILNRDTDAERKKAVREAVRERYAELALKGRPCCGSGEAVKCGCSGIYSQSELDSIPLDASGISAGCGNPTAIARLSQGNVVVDLGSGGGIDVFLAAGRVGEAGRVYGIDATPEMVFRARKAAADAGYRNVEFRLGEIEHVPLPDGVADVVISNCVINLSPEKQKVFDEAYRILRPGGRLAISDILLLKPLPPEISDDLAAWSSCVAGAVLEDEYISMMKKSGFTDVVIEDRAVYSAEQVRAYLIAGDAKVSGISDTIASCRISASRPDLSSPS